MDKHDITMWEFKEGGSGSYFKLERDGFIVIVFTGGVSGSFNWNIRSDGGRKIVTSGRSGSFDAALHTALSTAKLLSVSPPKSGLLKHSWRVADVNEDRALFELDYHNLTASVERSITGRVGYRIQTEWYNSFGVMPSLRLAAIVAEMIIVRLYDEIDHAKDI